MMQAAAMPPETAVIVTAYNEGDRLPATLVALEGAFPGARVIVADDGSIDGTAHAALQAGVELVQAPRTIGKGGAATLAAAQLPDGADADPGLVVVLCDGDLGQSAAELEKLVAAVRDGRCDLAVASFAQRLGGGFGLALSFARWAIERLCGRRLEAPISGQRAVRGGILADVLPFADGFGMEIGMTVDAVRAGHRVQELALELEHRATGRSLAGFLHRGRQLADFVRVYASRSRTRKRGSLAPP